MAILELVRAFANLGLCRSVDLVGVFWVPPTEQLIVHVERCVLGSGLRVRGMFCCMRAGLFQCHRGLEQCCGTGAILVASLGFVISECRAA